MFRIFVIEKSAKTDSRAALGSHDNESFHGGKFEFERMGKYLNPLLFARLRNRIRIRPLRERHRGPPSLCAGLRVATAGGRYKQTRRRAKCVIGGPGRA